MTQQVLTILGSTGSIGVNTLDVITRHPEKFRVFALTGHRQINKLAAQCLQFQPQYTVVADADSASALKQKLTASHCTTEVLYGKQALIDVASAHEVHGVMAAIVGVAGLSSALAAAKAGKTIYLANKEALVVAGQLFMQTAKENGVTVLPVDSEHNAIYQTLPYQYDGHQHKNGIRSIILTASGGPFLETDLALFDDITPAQAIKHPNWSMGQKISVDSASMMNKGLEVIEAHWLFNCPPEKLEVIIHPQSVIHSMVRYLDGSVLAQLGTPDMRIPIAYCLGLPERIDSGANTLDFTRLGALTFDEPDFKRFPCLKLAYDAMAIGNNATCILNAANEEAVAAFLNGRIRFTDIARVIDHCLQHSFTNRANDLDSILDLDVQSRAFAIEYITSLKTLKSLEI